MANWISRMGIWFPTGRSSRVLSLPVSAHLNHMFVSLPAPPFPLEWRWDLQITPWKSSSGTWIRLKCTWLLSDLCTDFGWRSGKSTRNERLRRESVIQWVEGSRREVIEKLLSLPALLREAAACSKENKYRCGFKSHCVTYLLSNLGQVT